MAKKESHVIIAYFSGTDQADAAVDQLKAWDKATDAIKLGGMGILTWKDGKVHTRKVGARATGTGANYFTKTWVSVMTTKRVWTSTCSRVAQPWW
jgi:hypothetical protein